MQPKKQNNYNYDSVKAHYAKYKDSVAVDWVYSAETGSFTTIYVAKGEDYIDTIDHSTAAEAQYYIVPLFIAIMIALIIFAFVLYRDNAAALNQKKHDNIMDFINNK